MGSGVLLSPYNTVTGEIFAHLMPANMNEMLPDNRLLHDRHKANNTGHTPSPQLIAG